MGDSNELHSIIPMYLMDMCSLLGTTEGPIPSYTRYPYDHPKWSLGKPGIDSSSFRDV